MVCNENQGDSDAYEAHDWNNLRALKASWEHDRRHQNVERQPYHVFKLTTLIRLKGVAQDLVSLVAKVNVEDHEEGCTWQNFEEKVNKVDGVAVAMLSEFSNGADPWVSISKSSLCVDLNPSGEYHYHYGVDHGHWECLNAQFFKPNRRNQESYIQKVPHELDKSHKVRRGSSLLLIEGINPVVRGIVEVGHSRIILVYLLVLPRATVDEVIVQDGLELISSVIQLSVFLLVWNLWLKVHVSLIRSYNCLYIILILIVVVVPLRMEPLPIDIVDRSLLLVGLNNSCHSSDLSFGSLLWICIIT